MDEGIEHKAHKPCESFPRLRSVGHSGSITSHRHTCMHACTRTHAHNHAVLCHDLRQSCSNTALGTAVRTKLQCWAQLT